MISVAVLGTGRMGKLALELIDQDANLKLHAALNSSSKPEQMLGADVVLDFTLPDASPALVGFAIEHDMKIVVGTSGWSESKLQLLESKLAQHPASAAIVIPNFSVGSMLLQHFSAMAAKYFDSIEIVEAHHAGKVDSPSGTAVRTAELIAGARQGLPQPLIPGVNQSARGEVVAGVPIHSLRLQGVAAKQDVHFGSDSELTTLSHEVISHRAYSKGILLSIDFALKNTGLHVGLDKVVGL
jgi:4-hydroxy-tetrahydrodipicolinate reductase